MYVNNTYRKKRCANVKGKKSRTRTSALLFRLYSTNTGEVNLCSWVWDCIESNKRRLSSVLVFFYFLL